MSLKLGLTRQMPAWAKLQFTSHGVGPEDLDYVLRRVEGLESWSNEWEAMGRSHEARGRDALAWGRTDEAAKRFLTASAAYNSRSTYCSSIRRASASCTSSACAPTRSPRRTSRCRPSRSRFRSATA